MKSAHKRNVLELPWLQCDGQPTTAFSAGQGRRQSGPRGIRFEPGRRQHPLQEAAPVNRLGPLGEVYRRLFAAVAIDLVAAQRNISALARV